MHSRLCDWLYLVSAIRLDWVSTHDAISLARNMFMHYHALHVVFFFLVPYHMLWFFVFLLSLFLSLSYLVSLSWHLRNPFLLNTRFIMVPPPLLLLLLILLSSVMRKHEMSYLKTFLTGWFIWNARSFYLTF